MPTVREGNVFPAAGGKKNRLPEGRYGKKVPGCLPRDGNGTGRWEAIWLMGWYGNTRFFSGHGTGREMVGERVGKSVGNIVGMR